MPAGMANIHIPYINIHIPSMNTDQHLAQKHPTKELPGSTDLFLSFMFLYFLFIINKTSVLIDQLVLSR